MCRGPCRWRGLVRVFDLLGDHFENCASGGVLSKGMPRRNIVRERNERSFHLFLQNLRGASSLCKSDEVFWTEDLIEETTKQLQDSNYTILILIEHDMYVCPYELSPTQSRSSSLRPVLHMLAFRTKTMSMSVSPTLNLRKNLPILILTSRTRSSKAQS